MSEYHTLAIRIVHQDPASFMALAVDVRRQVEVGLLTQVQALVPLTTQEDWLDPANLPISAVTVNGVTSFTLAAIDQLFATKVAALNSNLTVGSQIDTNCRFCAPNHCDRTCRDLLLDDKPWELTQAIPETQKSVIANVWIEFEFPSGN
jgi:hypothetical protein